MGLFSKILGGGTQSVVRCDETDFLIWKYQGGSVSSGTSIIVKDGEVAVLIGTSQTCVEGPANQTATEKLSEVYFINLAGSNVVRFAVPYFGINDPRFPDLNVPVAVRGSINFNIQDGKAFTKMHRLVGFDMEAFQKKIKDAVVKYVKSVVTNIPSDNGIPLVQMEKKILEISEILRQYLLQRLAIDFAVNVRAVDLNAIEYDPDDDNYKQLKSLTQGQAADVSRAQHKINVETMQAQHSINLETMRMQSKVNLDSMRAQSEANTETIQTQARLNLDALKESQRQDLKNRDESLKMDREVRSEIQRQDLHNRNEGLRMDREIRLQDLENRSENLKMDREVRSQELYDREEKMRIQRDLAEKAGNVQIDELQKSGRMAMGSMPGMGQALGGFNPSGINQIASPNPIAQIAQPTGINMGGVGTSKGSLTPPPPVNTTPQIPPQIPQVSIYVAIGGQAQGPFDYNMLKEMVKTGGLTAQTLVWKEGIEWTPAIQVPEVASILNAPQVPPPTTSPTPPPPPGVPPTL